MRELKNNLSRYLDRVRPGEDVIVTDRGTPIARLSAIDEDGSERAALISDSADPLSSAALVIVEGRAALAATARIGRLTRTQLERAKGGTEPYESLSEEDRRTPMPGSSRGAGGGAGGTDTAATPRTRGDMASQPDTGRISTPREVRGGASTPTPTPTPTSRGSAGR